jgi:hypothetical protein
MTSEIRGGSRMRIRQLAMAAAVLLTLSAAKAERK